MIEETVKRLKEDGGPVHPVSVVVDNTRVDHDGIRLRDYFAAAALTGLLSRNTPMSPEACAKLAYRNADAMLAAGKVGP